MAYQAPKWTQLTTPSSATSVNALTSAGDLFSKAIDKAQDTLTSYDEGVESRLQEDSDVNTAALRRRLESATDLDSLNAMQGDISATGLKGYGKRIDADALSQSFDKERGVLRGEFEQEYNEDFSQRLNQAKTPAEYELIRQSMATNPKYFDDASRITALGAGTDKAIQTQTDQSVLEQGIKWRNKSSKEINEEIGNIKGDTPGAQALIAAGNLAAQAALTRETNNFSELTTTKIRAAKTTAEYDEIASEIAKMQIANPEMNLTPLINSSADLKERVDAANQLRIENDLAMELEGNDNVENLTKLRIANKNTAAPNWRVLDSQYASQIKQATENNRSRKIAGISKSGLTASPQDLLAELEKVDTEVLGSEFEIQAYNIAIQQADTRLQDDFDKKVLEELEAAKDVGIVALTDAAKRLKKSLPENSRVDIAGVEQMVNTLREAALGSSVSTITSNKLSEQQATFSGNDTAVRKAVETIGTASNYVTVAKNGQVVFAKNTPQNIIDRVSIEARANGYKEPIRGLTEDKGAFKDDLIQRGFSPDQATSLTDSIDKSLSISFDFNDSTQKDYETEKANLERKQSSKLQNAEKVFDRIETDLFAAKESIQQNVVGDFSEDISVWVENNIAEAGWFGFSENFDKEEINRMTDTLLNTYINVTKNNKTERILIPAPALKVVLSRSRDADGQVDTPTAWAEAGGIEDLARSVEELMNRENDALTRSISALSQYNTEVQKIEVAHAASVSALATSLKVRDNVRQKNLLPDASRAQQRIDLTNFNSSLRNQGRLQQGQGAVSRPSNVTTGAINNSILSSSPRPAWVTNWIQNNLTNKKPTSP